MAGRSPARLLQACLGDPRCTSGALLGDLVITAAEELDQAEAVAEGIGQHDDLAPGLGPDFRFGPRAGVTEPDITSGSAPPGVARTEP